MSDRRDNKVQAFSLKPWLKLVPVTRKAWPALALSIISNILLAVIDFYKKALRTAKLITDDSDIGKYYYHGVSHSLGLDTHDPCDRAVYEPGMVLTNEPGLYVAEEGIGIRLENDILVTDGAPEDLIGDRLLCIDYIENLMA